MSAKRQGPTPSQVVAWRFPPTVAAKAGWQGGRLFRPGRGSFGIHWRRRAPSNERAAASPGHFAAPDTLRSSDKVASTAAADNAAANPNSAG